MTSRRASTDLGSHDERVAADQSAARLLINEHAGRVRNAIEQSLANNDDYEYAVSIARPSPDEPRVVGGPTEGMTPGEVSVHVPNRILAENGASFPDELLDDVSPEPAINGYADLVKLHTHFRHDGPEVGLSYGDLTDAVPGPDNLVTRDVPMEIYRAQSAVVYTDDENRLPIDTDQERFPLDEAEDEWTDEAYLFDERPEVRPWLHLVERTPEAVAMDRGEAMNLHHDSLEHTGNTHAEKFRNAREALGDKVAELIVPLSP